MVSVNDAGQSSGDPFLGFRQRPASGAHRHNRIRHRLGVTLAFLNDFVCAHSFNYERGKTQSKCSMIQYKKSAEGSNQPLNNR